MICGGMPEPALRMVETMDIYEVEKSMNQILGAYALDFSKHAEKTEALRIRYVWEAIPAQLAKENKNSFIKPSGKVPGPGNLKWPLSGWNKPD